MLKPARAMLDAQVETPPRPRSIWLLGALAAVLVGAVAGYACYAYETAGAVRLGGQELLKALLALI